MTERPDEDDIASLRTATGAARVAALDIRTATDCAVEVTSDMREATGDARLAITEARVATETTRTSEASARHVDTETRRSSADARDATANTRDATADTREASADSRDATADTREASADTREATADTREATADSRDATADSRDATADTRDATADTRDAAADTRDATADTRDEHANRLLAEELQRSNEELRRLDQLKSEFVAMASHELRTPLASITGFSSTMLTMWDTIPEAEKLRYVGIIDVQSQRLARLVGDLLSVANIESGGIKTTPVNVNIGRAVAQTIQELGVDGVDVDCDVGAEAFADADHVQQILVNFISNAVKYGAAPITVDTAYEDECVCIRVSDSGDGVPEQFVPRLFDRFARGRGDGCSDGTGTGLGLSITDGLARAQGGSVWFEPNEPVGARFTVRLPRARIA
ncbi:MAG: multi-sensor hybrid histidine kinase [Thermoleophilia bacterium]|nr:multi-sensor hybrid histidine kinase [Thermoleophilia bacterium]